MMKTLKSSMSWCSACIAALLLAGCAVTDIGTSPALTIEDSIAIIPIANHTETPQAGLRVEAIAESLLRTEQGFSQLKRYPASLNPESLFEPAERESVSNGLEWARNEHMRYALTGTVSEWRYKVGADGEPVVGVALQLIDVNSGQVVWSAAGSRTGWSRSAVSGVAQKLLRRLLSPLETD